MATTAMSLSLLANHVRMADISRRGLQSVNVLVSLTVEAGVWALQTSPMPAAPSWDWISYGPSVVPDCNDTGVQFTNRRCFTPRPIEGRARISRFRAPPPPRG